MDNNLEAQITCFAEEECAHNNFFFWADREIYENAFFGKVDPSQSYENIKQKKTTQAFKKLFISGHRAVSIKKILKLK